MTAEVSNVQAPIEVTKDDKLVFRYRAFDSDEYVSRKSVQEASVRLGITETAFIHRALARYLRAGAFVECEDLPSNSDLNAISTRANQILRGKMISGASLV